MFNESKAIEAIGKCIIFAEKNVFSDECAKSVIGCMRCAKKAQSRKGANSFLLAALAPLSECSTDDNAIFAASELAVDIVNLMQLPE